MAKFYRAGTMDPWCFKLEETWYSLGMSVLSEHLRAAAKFFIEGTKALHHTHTHPASSWARMRNKQLAESYLFVTGTGIEFIINSYGLEVDPEAFKEGFWEWASWQKRMSQHMCSSSSAIMSGGWSIVA